MEIYFCAVFCGQIFNKKVKFLIDGKNVAEYL